VRRVVTAPALVDDGVSPADHKMPLVRVIGHIPERW
jgi:hypothetical protein